MKKLLLLFVIAAFAVSCEGPQGPQGPPGRDGEGVGWFVDYYTVNQNDWILVYDVDGNPFYRSPAIRISYLTENVYDYGVVMAYIEIDNNFQTPLPYQIYRINGRDNWAELLDYEYTPGSITFYSTLSDFNESGVKPETSVFKVILLW